MMCSSAHGKLSQFAVVLLGIPCTAKLVITPVINTLCSWPCVTALSRAFHLRIAGGPGLFGPVLLGCWSFMTFCFQYSLPCFCPETSCVTFQLIPDSFAHWGRTGDRRRKSQQLLPVGFLPVTFNPPHFFLTSTSCRDSGILFVLFFQHLLHPKQKAHSASQQVTLKMSRSRPVEPLL